MRKRFLSFFFTCWAVSAASAQQPANGNASCEEIFRRACLKSRELDAADDRIMHTAYRSVSHFRTDAKQPLQSVQTDLDLYVGKGMVYYSGKEATCMQDARQTVSILPQSRRILVAGSTPERTRMALHAQWRTTLQDSLLAWTILSGCRRTAADGKDMHQLVFSVPPAYQARMGVRQMTIWLDARSYQARRLEIIYPAGSPVEKNELFFSEPEWLAAVPHLPASAQALVWDKAGRVLPAYRQYEIVHLNK